MLRREFLGAVAVSCLCPVVAVQAGAIKHDRRLARVQFERVLAQWNAGLEQEFLDTCKARLTVGRRRLDEPAVREFVRNFASERALPGFKPAELKKFERAKTSRDEVWYIASISLFGWSDQCPTVVGFEEEWVECDRHPIEGFTIWAVKFAGPEIVELEESMGPFF